MLTGKWKQESQPIHLINIYSPCNLQDKRMLWENIRQLKYQSPEGYWCIVGDFNNIRNAAERMGSSQRGLHEGNIKEFNDWIAELEVEEAPWVGKRFTWFRPNGSAKSKLDRFLISPEWLSKWSASSQYTFKRNFSDHCPIMLKSQSIDWGPRPFRVLDCWLKDQSFKQLVQQSWSNNNQRGWGGYVLKQKIKALKVSIKEWNNNHYGDTHTQRERVTHT